MGRDDNDRVARLWGRVVGGPLGEVGDEVSN